MANAIPITGIAAPPVSIMAAATTPIKVNDEAPTMISKAWAEAILLCGEHGFVDVFGEEVVGSGEVVLDESVSLIPIDLHLLYRLLSMD
jgi:hypothetical protein